jgi:hypothetical protein
LRCDSPREVIPSERLRGQKLSDQGSDPHVDIVNDWSDPFNRQSGGVF